MVQVLFPYSREKTPVHDGTEKTSMIDDRNPKSNADSTSLFMTNESYETVTTGQLEDKVNRFLEKFSSTQDTDAAIACLEEITTDKPLIVKTILLKVVQGSPKMRQLAITLFVELDRNGLVGPTEFTEGAENVLEEAQNLLDNIPQLWKYLAEIFDGLVSMSDRFPVEHLATFCNTLHSLNEEIHRK